MAGGDGESDPAEPIEGTPPPETPALVEPPALPFSYDDIPETLTKSDAEVWLRAREAQMQSGFSKAVGEAQDARKRAESALTIQERLENEESRREAIGELLQPYGIELEWPEAEVEGAEPLIDDVDLEFENDEPDSEVDERLRRVEERFDADDQKAREGEWIGHVTSHLNAFAEREGVEGGAAAIPKPIRDTIIGHALQAKRLDGGMLDIEAGIGAYDESVEIISQRTRQGYLGSKDTPTITIGGGAADPHTDLSTQAARLAAGNKIAQRHGH